MPFTIDQQPSPDYFGDSTSSDDLYAMDDKNIGPSMGQEINERRAQSENPEALRLARAL